MRGNSMLGEDMDEEESGEFRCIEGVVCGDEDRLLGEAVYDDQDVGLPVGGRKLLDEVHGDGIPRALRDGELLQSSVRKMSGGLGSRAGGTGFAVVADEEAESGPGIVAEYESLSLVLTPVSCSRMIVAGLEYAKSQVVDIGDVDATIEAEDSVVV